MARTTQILRAKHEAAKVAPRTRFIESTTAMPEKQQQYQYPGINVDLRHLTQDWRLISGVDCYRVGCFELSRWHSMTPIIMVREVAMTLLMDRLTDKPKWHEKVFDEEIVSRWKQETLTAPEDDLWNSIITDQILQDLQEALQEWAEADPEEIDHYNDMLSRAYHPHKPARQRIISEQAFDYCIAELRCKAAEFEKSGLIFTLNTNENTAIKSDSAVTAELHQALKAAFDKLVTEQGSSPDWHPWAQDMVQDLVHPSMHPFVYGKSLFLQDEVVGVEDAVEKWAGKGQVIEKPITKPREEMSMFNDYNAAEYGFWSERYQWLPANLAFQDDGTVKFTSYINNLHPKRHPEIYRTIERLIDTAIPAWERVLSGWAVTGEPYTQRTGQHRGKKVVPVQQRFGPAPVFGSPDDDDAYEPLQVDLLPELIREWEEKNGRPVPLESDEMYEVENWTWPNDYTSNPELYEGLTLEEQKERALLIHKWNHIRDVILPEPLDFQQVSYTVQHKLSERFRDIGLQVIVKMATIELTPEKPEFPVGGWHIEGMMNEHIVATALYYLDSENITTSSLEFRMKADEHPDLEDRVGQDNFRPNEVMYGCRLREGEALQKLGNVETREGRLLAFPNVFQHRVSPFSLQDRTKPGHRRFIALWLVDPHQRIISTANVPPQQLDWWAEAVFGGKDQAAKGDIPSEVFQLLLEQGLADTISPPKEVLDRMSNRLPAELMDMVRKERILPEGLMTKEEAKEHRLQLMKERSRFQEDAEETWKKVQFNFCEH
ncbi:hypothetical protein QBC41DRAFT_23066 [Cercophora samala]|uniref:DUF1665 domain-containing protein n=1 Tax=Cercophora samala TaxID=330535 RepID=A0AA39Z5C4_9PEZI|nr:hypothetical protein QBC41DRAFT_23066 [Cercophora samala]